MFCGLWSILNTEDNINSYQFIYLPNFTNDNIKSQLRQMKLLKKIDDMLK
jgi:hypothetical protein